MILNNYELIVYSFIPLAQLLLRINKLNGSLGNLYFLAFDLLILILLIVYIIYNNNNSNENSEQNYNHIFYPILLLLNFINVAIIKYNMINIEKIDDNKPVFDIYMLLPIIIKILIYLILSNSDIQSFCDANQLNEIISIFIFMILLLIIIISFYYKKINLCNNYNNYNIRYFINIITNSLLCILLVYYIMYLINNSLMENNTGNSLLIWIILYIIIYSIICMSEKNINLLCYDNDNINKDIIYLFIKSIINIILLIFFSLVANSIHVRIS